MTMSSNDQKLRIGSRGSELALWQTNWVKDTLLGLFPGLSVEITIIKTTGDKILDAPLAKIGDKGLFTKELEHAILEDRVDLAVHSLKDVPTAIPEGLSLAAISEREDVHDVFVAHPTSGIASVANLPTGSTIATGSLRRKSQLLHWRPDFNIVDIRGNVNTRMQKLEASDWSGMILAKAGMVRLGWDHRISDILPFDRMLPAVGQGALAIETRSDDKPTRQYVEALHHRPTEIATTAERSLLRALEGGCQIPIGALGRVENGTLSLEAVVGSLDGKKIIRRSISGAQDEANALGIKLAEQLLQAGARKILDSIRSSANN